MHKILLVEDDEDKREQISALLNTRFVCELEEVRSFTSAIKSLRNNIYDVILLDMTMPTFDVTSIESGGRAQPFGGELILDEMNRKSIISKVIVITQFDLFGEGEEEISLSKLDNKLKKQFEPIYLGAIHYSISYTSWQDLLESKLKIAGLK